MEENSSSQMGRFWRQWLLKIFKKVEKAENWPTLLGEETQSFDTFLNGCHS